eukprot:g2731.t1
MADCSKALSDVLDYNHTKDARLTALHSVQSKLDSHEQLDDVLDAVGSKWRKLTNCFLEETDYEILNELSRFLSSAGKTAVVFGRFSANGINQFIYLSWTAQQLRRLDPTVWQMELILEGLTACLDDLEGSAFKSVAPALISSCCCLLGKAATPIGVFGQILDLFCCLSKAPSAIRDQFKEMVDLILGWAAYPDCPVDSRPKVRTLFLKLRPHWQENLEYGRNIILSVATDLCDMLDSELVDSGSSGFANVICCLISIFESCSMWLTNDMLSQVFAQLNLIIKAVTLFPTLNEEELSIVEFAEQMGEKVKILLGILIMRQVPNGVQNMFNYLNRPMTDPQLPFEATTGILHLHSAFLDVEEISYSLKEIELSILKAYGLNSTLHNLRSCCSGNMVKSLVNVYKRLIMKSTYTIQQHFIQLFLSDICRHRIESSASDSGSRGSFQFSIDSPGGNVNLIRRVKEQVFGLKLFIECFDNDDDEMESQGGLHVIVWDKISHSVKNETPKHPLVFSHSIKLLKSASLKLPASSLIVFKLQTELIIKPELLENEKITTSILEWTLDSLDNCDVEMKKLPENMELSLLSRLTKHSTSVSIQKLVLRLYCKLIKTGFQFQHGTEFLQQIYTSASNLYTEIASGALQAIQYTGTYTFSKFLHSVQVQDPEVDLITSPESLCVLTSHHITSLLKNLSTKWFIEDTGDSRRTDWVLQLSQELNPTRRDHSLRTLFTTGRFLVHEIAKQIIMNRFRHFKSGPAHLLRHLSDQFTQIQQSFHEKPMIDHFHFWMILEFCFALEKQVYLAHEGTYTQTIIQGFYIANKQTFEEWFNALNFKILVISHKCGFDYHAVHYGCAFLKQQVQDLVKDGSSMLMELIPPPVQQKILKVRQKPQQERSNKQLALLRQFLKGLTYTALSFYHLGDPDGLIGLKSELLPFIEGFVKPVEGMESPVFVSWMDGMSLEAAEKTEDAVHSYNHSFQQIMQTEEAAISLFPVIEIRTILQKTLHLLKVFILERLAHCYTRLADWETFEELRDQVMSEKEYRSKLRMKIKTFELEMLYDQDCFDEILNQTQNWKEYVFEFRNLDDLRDSLSLMTIKKMSKEQETDKEQDYHTSVLSNLQHLIGSQETVFSSRILQISHILQSMKSLVVQESVHEVSRRMESMLELIFPDLSLNRSPEFKLDPHLLRNLLRLDLDELSHGVFTLIFAKFEIDHKNYNHAAKLLQMITNEQNEFPDWFKLAAKSEQSRLVFLGAENDSERSLMWSHYSQILYQDLKNLRDGPQSTLKKLLAVHCSRYVDCLEPLRHSVNHSGILADLLIPEVTGEISIQLWMQMEEAGLFRDISLGDLTVLKTQGYCISSALDLDPTNSSCWKKLGFLFLSRATRNPVVLRNGVSALCKALETENKTQMDYEVILEIFDLVKKTGEDLLDPQRTTELESLPVKTWKSLQTQLISLLGHPCQRVRQLMVTLLKRVSDLSPSAVLYPVLVEWKKNRTNHELNELMSYFEHRKPEDWLNYLNEVHMESQIRLPVFQEELRRIKQETKGDQLERNKLFKEAYDLILTPLVQSMKSRVQDRRTRTGQFSVYEQDYWNGLEPRIEALLIQLDNPVHLIEAPELEKRWTGIKHLLKEITEAAKKPLPVLSDLAPRLTQLQDTGLPLPGSDSISIDYCEAHVKILSTKTRPKILKLRGSDHQSYSFLLKGKEDLKIDHRLLQILQISTELLHLHSKDSNKTLRVYNVTPLGDRLGLIQWVDHTISFYSLFTQWQENEKRRVRISNEAGNEVQRKRSPLMMEVPPTLLFKRRLSQAFAEAELPKSLPRGSWPHEILQKLLERLQQEAPRDLLKQQIFKQSSSASVFWRKTRRFTQSTSVSSVLCYLLGLGDRHLDNLLLDLSTAEVINIDFNLCFGSGRKLRVPEIVPFRLTQIMEEALGIGKKQGQFKVVFSETLEALRGSKKCLLILLDAILSDPVMDWTSNRANWSFKQGLDQYLRLKLVMNRFHEKTGDHRIIQDCFKQSMELTKSTQNFVSASISLNQLTESQNQIKSKFQRLQDELSGLLEQQEALRVQFQEQENFHSDQMILYQEMKDSVDQIIQYNQNWCYRHGCLLQTLFNQSDELLLLSQESWNSSMTSVLTNIIIPSPTTGSSVLLTIFQNQDLESIIPIEILEECLMADQQRQVVDELRDTVFSQLLNALYHYIAILKILLSEDYISSSFHFRTMKKFQSITTEFSPVSSSAKNCYPVFEDLQKMYRSLSTAFRQIQDLIQQTKDHPTSEELVPIQRTAASKIVPLQRALSSWTPQLFNTLLIELCDQQIESIEKGIDSTEHWTKLSSGLAQLFRLFRSPRLSQALLSQYWNTDVNNSDSVSTGFLWLDGVEQYMSKIAMLIQSFKNGVLFDLDAFAKTGLISRAQFLNRVFTEHQIQAQEVCRIAWEASMKKQDNLESCRKLDQDKNRVLEQLELINERLTTESNLSPVQIQTLAQEQENLSHELQCIQEQYEAGENLRLEFDQNCDQISQKLESLCESFIYDLSGTVKQYLRFQNNGDCIEMQLSSLQWGDFNFPVLHSLFQIFEQLDAIDGGIRNLRTEHSVMQNHSNHSFNCPLSFQQFESWIEGITITCKLTSVLQETMTENSGPDQFTSILESHFLTLLERRARPILLTGLHELRSGLLKQDGQSSVETQTEVWKNGLEMILSFVKSQGEYSYCALLHESSQSWAKNTQPDQETRFHHLAAMQWCYQGLQTTQNEEQYLQDYLTANQYPVEAEIPSRQDLVLVLQDRLESLIQLDRPGEETEELSHAAFSHIEDHLSSSLVDCTDQEQATALIQQLQDLRNDVDLWKQGSKQQISKMAHIIQTLLQFELSRDGLTWNVGEVPDQQSFLQFEDWFNRTTDLTESIKSAEKLMVDLDSQYQSISTEIIDLQTKEESCKHELALIETELMQNQHTVVRTGNKLSSEMQDLMKTGPVLLGYLQNSLGPWLEKFTVLTQNNKRLFDIGKKGVEISPWIGRSITKQERVHRLIEGSWTELSSALQSMENELSQQQQFQKHDSDFLVSHIMVDKVQELGKNTDEVIEILVQLKQGLEALVSSSWKLIEKHDQTMETRSSSDALATTQIQKTATTECISTERLIEGSKDHRIVINTTGSEMPINEYLPETSSTDSSSAEPVVEADAQSSSMLLDQPMITWPLTNEQLEFRDRVLNEFQDRLTGMDFGKESGDKITVEAQTEALLGEATSVENLSKMYEGWMAWI